MTSRRVSAWLPVLVWAAVIFTFSAIPHLGTGLGVWDTILRKGAHTVEYAILGALLVRALGRETPAFLAGVAYAVTDEIHQLFVNGRHSSPVDVAIDSCGVLVGVLAFSRVLTMGTWPTGNSSTTASSTSSSSGSTTSSPRSAS